LPLQCVSSANRTSVGDQLRSSLLEEGMVETTFSDKRNSGKQQCGATGSGSILRIRNGYRLTEQNHAQQ